MNKRVQIFRWELELKGMFPAKGEEIAVFLDGKILESCFEMPHIEDKRGNLEAYTLVYFIDSDFSPSLLPSGLSNRTAC